MKLKLERIFLKPLIQSKNKNTSRLIENAEAVLNPNLFEKKIADVEQMIAVSQEFSGKEDSSNKEQQIAASSELGIDTPLAFSKKDRHSFSQWLQLTSATPIVREETPEQKKQNETTQKKIQE